MNGELSFSRDRRPEVDAIRALYAASPLRRPIHDPERIRRMFEGSNVVLSAWEGEHLVGLLRGWTDFVFDGYICDLAIHPDFQKAGLGRRLLDMAQGLGEGILWILVASPLARDYYAHLGWERIEAAWALPRKGWQPEAMETFQAQHADLAAKA